MEKFLGLPDLASAHGARLDHLTGLVHLLMLVLFVGWFAFFVFLLVRFRRGRNPQASYDGLKTHATSWLEGGVALAEAILLIGFSIPLWSQRVDAFPAEKDATVVEVVGEQFAWNVHYPGPDGVFGRRRVDLVDAQSNPLGLDPDDPAGKDDVTTINQLHLPVNKPAIVHLTSKDVIHSFMLPEMRVKQDAIPGVETPLWFVPNVTTDDMRQRKGDDKYSFEIACAQLCGIGHASMHGYLTVDTPEEYAAWMSAEEAKKAQQEENGGFWQ